ncbi:alpha/beta hydrolase [Sagittula sp. P11]|uniref:alpha/beta hydrolase n=1 Tax=Sagittula sp. P11 TaxID=2009329 RepID=UPI000C2D5819|nr:alpha/beta hydrolase [Sagittula sp. P11]AUC52959.1 alpha/beta hydrolase [Sagittula sp. P11]
MRAATPTSEGTIVRDGVTVHYAIHGNGPRTLMFLPAWPIVHSRVYKAQIPYFADHFRVISFDPRGNGLSDRPEDPDAYAPSQNVADALAILDATDTAKASLIGLSLGGLYAALIAAHAPERVTALVGCGAVVPFVPPHPHKSVDVVRATPEAPEGWDKFNARYWQTDYADFCAFFFSRMFCEPHSTKQIEDALSWAADGSGEVLARMSLAEDRGPYPATEEAYGRIRCPSLWVHGERDEVTPWQMSEAAARATGGEFQLWAGVGHGANARYPARFNTLVRAFLDRHTGTPPPVKRTRSQRPKRALYLSSPIGLGHARRDLAVTRELRILHPDLEVHWLAQDPVTRFLSAHDEVLHPASARLANESAHIEAESGEHDLNAFQAIRNMDEILIKNFMVFQEVVEDGDYDLVIADEAWDVDHYWHEHPDLKRAPVAWFTDFVGWVPIPENGAREAFLTADYNAEMIGHVEANPGIRDRAIFVGGPEDVIPMSFGPGLPQMRDWVPAHYDFSGYIIGQHPTSFGSRAELRERFGYREGEKVCIVTVGGSGVGASLIRRILNAYPIARSRIPELRMILVTGPRLNPAAFALPKGVEARAFVPDLDRHLAACDLALVQGGLTTTMELTAAGTPFLYFPLKNHFEQNFHVAQRLDRYNAGRRMIYDQSDPERIAQAMVEELAAPRAMRPVEADGARRAAHMLSDLL